MSIKLYQQIGFGVVGDGSSTEFSFDLLKDPYVVFGNGASSPSVGVENWFSKNPAASRPTGVLNYTTSSGPSFTASLSGTLVTLTFSSAPPGSEAATNCTVYLTFDSEG